MDTCTITQFPDGVIEVSFDGQTYMRTGDEAWFRAAVNLSAGDESGGSWNNRSLALMLESLARLASAVDHLRLG